MLLAPLPSCVRFLSRAGACALLLALSACEAESFDDEASFRADELDLEGLERGECLALPDTLESVSADAWTIWPSAPEGIIVEDNVMYLDIVIEDIIMVNVAGPASVDDVSLHVAAATLVYDDPELTNDCGFCDGLCVDGKCIMNLPPFAISRGSLCRE